MKSTDLYLLVNLETGGLDGFYSVKQMAHRIAEAKNSQNGKWIVTRITPDENPSCKIEIPEHLWWINRESGPLK